VVGFDAVITLWVTNYGLGMQERKCQAFWICYEPKIQIDQGTFFKTEIKEPWELYGY